MGLDDTVVRLMDSKSPALSVRPGTDPKSQLKALRHQSGFVVDPRLAQELALAANALWPAARDAMWNNRGPGLKRYRGVVHAAADVARLNVCAAMLSYLVAHDPQRAASRLRDAASFFNVAQRWAQNAPVGFDDDRYLRYLALDDADAAIVGAILLIEPHRGAPGHLGYDRGSPARPTADLWLQPSAISYWEGTDAIEGVRSELLHAYERLGDVHALSQTPEKGRVTLSRQRRVERALAVGAYPGLAV